MYAIQVQSQESDDLETQHVTSLSDMHLSES